MRIIQSWILLPLFLFGLLRTSEGQDIGDFVDTDPCYESLYEADENDDRKITGDEYITVVQALGPPGFLEDVETFAELPRIIRLSFNLLACLCSVDENDGECCTGTNAHISNVGTGPDETPSPEQEVYLFSVCSTTNRAIMQTLGTIAPTPSPSEFPSMVESESPTGAPATAAPVSVAPVTSAPATPSPATTAPVTNSPVTPSPVTASPVSAAPVVPTEPTTPQPFTPAPSSLDLPVEAEYEVAFRDGDGGDYAADLVGAMNELAPQVVAETWPDARVRRRLTVGFRPPTIVTGTIKDTCPPIITNDDTCHIILHSVTLIARDENNGAVEELFKTELDKAIRAGRLETILRTNAPNTQVYILTGLAVAPTAAPTAAAGLSSGATAAIAIGSIIAILAIGGALYVARRRNEEKEDREDTYFPGTAESRAISAPDEGELDPPAAAAAAATLGATQADYNIKGSKPRKSTKAYETLQDGGDSEKGGGNGDAESSSNAGSSGWSSSAGVSSLNTGSVDSGDNDAVAAAGATLAALGAASAIAGAGSRSNDSDDVPDVPDVSREDLDSAIEAGDWAAVGATAALLAAASDSQSLSSRSRKTEASVISRGGSSISSLDAARAAELDHLVDAGDWEGVVVAAARFENTEDTFSGDSGGRTGGSGHSQTTSLSGSPSKVAKRDEIREEVESLVRRVVPEEIDNVDEMMLQFKGREEELVETLRTMQERQVAQKARVQGQKQAKREARATAALGSSGLPNRQASEGMGEGGGINAAAAAGIGVGVAAAAGIAAAVGAASGGEDEESSSSDSGGESGFAAAAAAGKAPSTVGSRTSPGSSVEGDAYSAKKKRTALELAIEAGDWEAVGEAAAMMSDASVNSASTGEINRFANMGDASTLASGESSAADQRYQVNADRAAELDNMIDKGDWTGVVAAASRFSSVDHSENSPTAQDGVAAKEKATGSTASTDTDERKRQRLLEEKEALDQADVWMAIAEQNKGDTDVAASDAADWAIARSLSALKSAEAQGDLGHSSSEAELSESDRSV